MKLKHHDLEIELTDEWWAEADMVGFVPATKSYRPDRNATFETRIDDISPVVCATVSAMASRSVSWRTCRQSTNAPGQPRSRRGPTADWNRRCRRRARNALPLNQRWWAISSAP